MQYKRFSCLLPLLVYEASYGGTCLGLSFFMERCLSKKDIECGKWALFTHSNTAHVHTQTHRCALEQGALHACALFRILHANQHLIMLFFKRNVLNNA